MMAFRSAKNKRQSRIEFFLATRVIEGFFLVSVILPSYLAGNVGNENDQEKQSFKSNEKGREKELECIELWRS